ncbi:diguanylate cyclase domain-containing protein [Xanthobacter sediminis]
MEGSEAQIAATARDALCRIARAMFGVASAVIRFGEAEGADAAPSALVELCRWAAASPHGVVVEDVAADARLAALAFDGAGPAPRFCAAMALSEGGPAQGTLGTLVLLDPLPRAFSDDQRRQLADLAAVAGAQLRLEAAARSAAEQAGRYRLLADNSTDTIVRGNLDGVRLYISPAVRTLLGYEPEELVGQRAMDIVHPDDLPDFQVLMRQIREGRVDEGCSEQRQRHKNGSWVWIEAFIRLTRDAATGEPDGYVVSVRDVSRRKAAEERLAHLAAHDALTGLANRSLLQERLDAQLARARRAGTGCAVLCLDLDRFKQVNDSFGHEAGDEVLRAAAARFVRASRKDDLVARVGGDEFVVVLGAGAAPREAAERLARRLIEMMAEPVMFGGISLGVGLSVGIAVAGPEKVAAGLGANALLRAGDQALYAAKEGGRNRFVVAPDGSGREASSAHA